MDITSNKRLIVLLVLLLLSSVGMFGQEVKGEVVVSPVSTTVADAGSDEAQMELVSWLMASKQSQMSGTSNTSGTISTNGSGKKQFINNGMTANRILSRTFLKKAINHDRTIA